MERSFRKEVEALRLGAGETFRGEGILAVTKALLQSGVSYGGGYQGAPVLHLLDVMVDAKDLLAELGVGPPNGVINVLPDGLDARSRWVSSLASDGEACRAVLVVLHDVAEHPAVVAEERGPFLAADPRAAASAARGGAGIKWQVSSGKS